MTYPPTGLLLLSGFGVEGPFIKCWSSSVGLYLGVRRETRLLTCGQTLATTRTRPLQSQPHRYHLLPVQTLRSNTLLHSSDMTSSSHSPPPYSNSRTYLCKCVRWPADAKPRAASKEFRVTNRSRQYVSQRFITTLTSRRS